MKTSTLMHAMETYKNGTWFTIQFETQVTPPSKDKDRDLRKVIVAQVRSGVAYSHMASTIEKRLAKSDTDTAITNRSSWWSWVPGFEHILKKHNTKDQYYITVIPHKIYSVKYYVDGAEVTHSEWEKFNKSSSTRPDIMDIKVENVISVR